MEVPIHRTGKKETFSSQWNQSPFDILIKYLFFPCNDQQKWWERTAPLLARLMTSADYTVSEQYEYLSFFRGIVVPWLGPFPQKFPSAVTHSGLPLEFSVNFQQHGKSNPVVRLAVEPLSVLSGTNSDPNNQHAISQYLSFLESLGLEGYDGRLFKSFVPLHTVNDSLHEALNQLNEKTHEHSQVAFGFDLKPLGTSVKGYTFPTLKCKATNRKLFEIILESIKGHAEDGLSHSALGPIGDYVHERNGYDQLGFVFSWDCVALSKTRLKLYARDQDMSWPKVQDIWTLGGRSVSDESEMGLSYLKRLWSLLEMGDHAHPLQLPMVWNYETKNSLLMPHPKVYFPLYGISDSKNVCAITKYLEEIGLKEYGACYEETIQEC